MLDIKFIRENPDKIRAALKAKNVNMDLDAFLALDEKRRIQMSEIDNLRAQQNKANEDIAALKKQKQDASSAIAQMRELAAQIKIREEQIKPLLESFENQLLYFPNIPSPTSPVGGEKENRIAGQWGQKREFSFKPKEHVDIADKRDLMDFQCAAKITGSNFALFKGNGALLERALINFMLDLHVQEHGYTEIAPPFMVNRATMTGTGQLPKMEEDMYKLSEEDFFLIPTAEVPVTNVLAGVTLKESDLPVKYVAYTPCFRREAGSYGKDTRGLMRLHQFDKVELVRFVHPDNSYDQLIELRSNAEKVLQLLELPYRILDLATGDMSFAAAKCYDIELWAPGLDRWLEVSSCSNFEDFQARRAGIRFNSSGKKRFVHTLNGSGVALARLVIAIIENYQNEDGSVTVPAILRKYMYGKETI